MISVADRLGGRLALLGVLALGLPGLAHEASAATITIQVSDGPNEGFNDPTPFTPIGGNTATTLGEARRKVFEEAARIWGTLLTSSITIKVDAKFDPLACTATTGSLGAAGPVSGYYNFPNSPQPGVLFPSAMADAIANLDLAEQSPQSAGSADIRATFNSSVDSDPVCLGGRRFYYGLDHQLDRDGNGTRDFASDLLRVVLHELGHGLGFISIVDLATGNGVNDSGGTEHFAIYDQFIYDETVALSWPQMNAAQRLQSSHNNGNLAWSGTRVNAHLNRLSAGISTGRRLRLYAPAAGSTTGGPVSHWDTVATPSLLMEPFETAVGGSTTDFTTCALGDMGWTLTARACPDLPNSVPVATAQTVSATEDTARAITLAGSDADGDTLRFAVAAPPTRGTLSGTAPNLTYTPNANANGADSFTFTSSDDQDTSAPATVTINVAAVNDAPTASAASANAVTAQATAITLQGTDPDGDVLTYELVAQPANGRVSASGAAATYTSNAGFSGTDTFTFRVSDGTLVSAAATVTVTVSAAAAPPPASGGGGSGGGGGGGSIEGGTLLPLLLWMLHRRATRAVARTRGDACALGPSARRARRRSTKPLGVN